MAEATAKTLEELLDNEALIGEINQLAFSEDDVTWGEYMVVIVLRSEDEIRRAVLLNLKHWYYSGYFKKKAAWNHRPC